MYMYVRTLLWTSIAKCARSSQAGQGRHVLCTTIHLFHTRDEQAYHLTYRGSLVGTYLSGQTVFRADAAASDGTTIRCVVKLDTCYCDTTQHLDAAPRQLYCSFANK